MKPEIIKELNNFTEPIFKRNINTVHNPTKTITTPLEFIKNIIEEYFLPVFQLEPVFTTATEPITTVVVETVKTAAVDAVHEELKEESMKMVLRLRSSDPSGQSLLKPTMKFWGK